MDFTYPSTAGAEELRLLKPISITRHFLKFRIEKFSRTATPSYTAVSYTWGIGEASELIYLNGQTFHVRLNLWSCLYYLGQVTNHAGWTHLWVDAICIDQSNDDERDAQVRRMDKTYGNAECVSVWLGLPKLEVPDQIVFPRHRLPTKTLEVDAFDWCDHVGDLANRSYWSRFWVVQEFLLGKNVMLYCGNAGMRWDDFRDILYNEAGVSGYIPEFGAPGHATNSVVASYRALPLVRGRHVDKHPEYLQPFHDLIINHHRSECQDPRDRVFALLGLVTPRERDFLERFFPDYSMSEEHVRIIALAHVMQYPASTSFGEVTPDSDELFLGLGVTSRWERRSLLRRARLEEFDYLGYENTDEALSALTWSTIGCQRGSESDEEDDDRRDGTNTIYTIPGRLCLVVGCIFLLATAIQTIGRFAIF
ncbi:heterokaryon incompatibility protein-domain-containing protein [Chaetomidium leptoderma]|uniref:Heterokaryon incompatibility protein-domain-containing protein n=1 Tax=Chaetomidium leptoderma TaxID=669021 RepID=A0AAN6ZZF2_9PEZI|nr:heterokaryon incompatibility protein-domain-containing protein [Chaetomidium leptoderma]